MSPAEKTQETPAPLRLAFRIEGDWWVAYTAPMDTMDGAIRLGTIAKGAVGASAKLKQAFMDLMIGVLDDFLQDALGVKAEFGAPQRTPEHERAGRA